MNLVLIDTSIWIEFFRKDSKQITQQLVADLIEQDDVGVCNVIQAEVFSAPIDCKTMKELQKSFEALYQINVDLNQKETWNKLIEMARICQKNKKPIPGLIDRIILLCALEHNAKLWSLDKKLNWLAEKKKCLYKPSI